MSFLLNGGHVLYPDRPNRPDPFQLGVSHGVHHLFEDILTCPGMLKARFEELDITTATIVAVVETKVLMTEEGSISASVLEIDTIAVTIEEVDDSSVSATVEDC